MKACNAMHLLPQITVTAVLMTDKTLHISFIHWSKTLLTPFELEFHMMITALSAHWSVKSDTFFTLLFLYHPPPAAIQWFCETPQLIASLAHQWILCSEWVPSESKRHNNPYDIFVLFLLVNGAWFMQISFLIQTRQLFHWIKQYYRIHVV